MQPFTTHTGRVLPLRRSDVDTDQIIPSDWLKRVSRSGFGAGLFAEWRADPGFVLNDPRRAGASVLVAGPNFGTGSSREHAVWALEDYGFRVVVSARFADIFRGNCLKVGVLPVQLAAADVDALLDAAERDPDVTVTVDLAEGRIRCAATGLTEDVGLDGFTRWRLTEGVDDIGLTLRHEADIAAYERRRPSWLPVT